MKPNPVAKDLRSPKYKMRVVQPGKGKGSWKRKEKHYKSTTQNLMYKVSKQDIIDSYTVDKETNTG